MVKLIFYTLSILLILSAAGVVTCKNPVHNILCLVLSFIISGMLWLFIHAEFLAFILIIVYVGAVMVLFLFVVMMLNIDVETARRDFWRNMPLAILLGSGVIFGMIHILIYKLLPYIPLKYLLQNVSAENISSVMYKQYVYPIELCSIILLLALLVAITLTLQENNTSYKKQNITQQIMADPKQRLRKFKNRETT
jgi:NADH-quinone oxidoreductase subunit J